MDRKFIFVLRCFFLCSLFVWLLGSRVDAVPVLSGVGFSQRADGSGLVDVSYDLEGAGVYRIWMAASLDGGATFRMVADTAGDVGAGITAGSGKRIVWNVVREWPGPGERGVKVRVGAWEEGGLGSFAPIPAGAYAVGNQSGDPEWELWPPGAGMTGGKLIPATMVEVAAFRMGTNLVTKAQWDRVRSWALGNGYPDLPVGGGRAEDHPVQTVSWYDVVKWANAASEREGLAPCYRVLENEVYRAGVGGMGLVCDWAAEGYRLPTGAEWEVAARGGLNGCRFPWGNTVSHSEANYVSNELCGYDLSPTRGGHPTGGWQTIPAGSLRANGYGLWDMAGNVHQWCWDFQWFRENGSSGGHDWLPGQWTRPAAEGRVARGGSCVSSPYDLRCAQQTINAPGSAWSQCGFRIVLSGLGAPGAMAESGEGMVNNAVPALSFSQSEYSFQKGREEAMVQVTVRRGPEHPERAVSAMVAVGADLEGTAVADFYQAAMPVVLNWEPGDTRDKTFPVFLRLGEAMALGQSVQLTLRNLSGARLGETGTARILVVPEDPGFLNFETTRLERVKPAAGDLRVSVVVRRVGGSTGAVGAEVAVAGGTARAGDYAVENPLRLGWGDGDVADKTFEVVFREGAVVPALGKTLQLKLFNFSGGTMAGRQSSATLVVRGREVPGTLVFSRATCLGVKDGTSDVQVPVCVNREAGGAGPVSVQVERTGGTAEEGTDYELPQGPVVLEWADGEMGSKAFTLTIKSTGLAGRSGGSVLLGLREARGGAQLGRLSACKVMLEAADLEGPTLVVESPWNAVTLAGERLLVTGTVTDASGPPLVRVCLNDTEEREAVLVRTSEAGTYLWMTMVEPEHGLNWLHAQAFDGLGNPSEMQFRNFTFLHSRPALVGTHDGRLERVLDDSLLALMSGESVEMFQRTRGEGLLSVVVTATGSFSGKLTTGGTTVSFKGILRRDGTAWFHSKTDSLEVARGSGAGRVVLGTLFLRVQETNGLPRLAGDFYAHEWIGAVAMEKFVYSDARMLPEGMRRVPVGVLDPASDNGRYTVLFEPRVDEGVETNGGLDPTQFPQACGFAKLTVSQGGVVSLAGRLADGTVLSYSNRLSASGAVPVYVPLYSGRGFLAGTPVFDATQPETDLAGPRMRWFRPAGVPAPYWAGWPGGISVDLVGSKYVPPRKTPRGVRVPANPHTVFGPGLAVPDFLGVRVGIGGGGLLEWKTQRGQLSSGSVFRVMGSEPAVAGLRMVFAAADGGFTGSFRHPVGDRMQRFAGVVFQKTGRAAGGFVFLPPGGASVPAAAGAVEVVVP